MQNSYSNENYAGFWVRLAAYVIDSVIVAIGLLVVRLAWIGIGALISGTILDENVLFHYSLKDIVLYIFKVMYFALLTWCTGTTIGKRLMNLRVVSADRNEKLSFVDVLYRETVGRFLCGISIWIGYIIVGIDKEKRGFHDMLCDTRVVYEKKVKMYSEYQSAAGPQMSVQPREPVQSQPQAPVQPQASEPLQAETFSGAVQQKTQEYMPVREQNYVQKNVQVQRQSQPGQPYRAVPDGGYSFVSDAGQVKKEFTQAESEKATGSTGENVTEIKENKEEVEDSIEENIQEGDL
ncbi:RDD family protein [Dorea formicigenerans]|uniref:RDD family protein n=1 Tax=Dorea formicigenerans TaxID=39486 RepID=A0A415UFB7_9FIRM|nr:RDD family protein [Dorea formicigenerans]RHN16846.1 RDD family protein [Dorea formicigenerans]